MEERPRQDARFVLTGVPVYPRAGRSAVDAIGIADGRVVATGPVDAVRHALPPGTAVRTVSGGAILPAFVDPHQHAYLVAADPGTDVLYRRARDIRGLVDLVATLARDAPETPGGWVRLHGYEPLRLAERRSPTARELDRAAPDRPMHVLTRTFHESVVNSAGLERLGIGRSTPDPAGGRIVRDRRGRATGVLLEAASFLAETASRGADEAGLPARIRAHGRRLLSLGIVRIGDAAMPVSVAGMLVEELASVGVAAHPLLVGRRIDEPAIEPGTTAKVLLDGGEYCHFRLTGREVGSLMAGSIRANLGADRALARAVGLRAGFPRRERDGRWHTGIRFPTERALPDLLRRAADAGAGLAVHADGNGAVEAILEAVDADPGLAAAVPIRVEHALIVDPVLAARLARASLPVVVQPGFIPAFGRELAVVPLPAKLRLMPLRTLHDAGVSLALSSDHPAATLSPWETVAAAVSRRDETGRRILPEESLDLATALDASTRGAAEVLHVADGGTLDVGCRADLIWCDRDPYAVPSDELAAISVRETWSMGSSVFRRD